MEKTAVTVKIFNDEYTLKTDLPRTDVDAIAAMVDKKMQKLATSQHLVTTSKVAVWAALDLAGELYTLRREYVNDKANHRTARSCRELGSVGSGGECRC